MAWLAARGQPAAHVSFTFSLPSRLYLWLLLLLAAVDAALARWAWGRALLLRFPALFSAGLFSREGPSEQQMREAVFMITNVARGYSGGAPGAPGDPPDIKLVTRVSGPEPGYVACALLVTPAAATLLEEGEALARQGLPGGVYTPAVLLRGSGYVERLQRRGIRFEVLSSFSSARVA